ncbi:Zinc finger C2HC domain-containing protein 1A [Mactra antiquata]
MDKYGGAAKGPKLDLKPCKHCGRTFVPESLAKHQANCQNIQKKRKVFDTSKQRATEDLSVRQIKAAQKKTVQPPKSHWKQKHEEFIRNIRAAKNAQVAMDMGMPLPPPPPPSENPDYVQCPYCNRRFNEKAAQRHIDFCKEQQSRIKAKREPTAQEKARAAAQKYQPPKPKGRGMDSTSPGGGYGAAPRGAPVPRGGPAPRAAPAGPGGSRSDTGRAPAGYGSSSQAARGRVPAGGATRGRAAPSQGSYAGRYGR